MTTGERSLQKRLLTLFHEQDVLNLFVYLTQDFSTPLHKKLAIHFMEIKYQIFSCFTPTQLINHSQLKQENIEKENAEEQARQRRSNFVKSMRHGKFGFKSQVMREDGSVLTVTNPYQKNIDLSLNTKNQLKKPKKNGAKAKDQTKVIEATQKIIEDSSADQFDEKLIVTIKNFLFDIIEHSYNPLIEALFDLIVPQKVVIEENDRFHLFSLQSFVLEAIRLKATSDHNKAQQESNA